MKKVLKKSLKIFLIVFIILLILAIVTPILFKGKIMQVVKDQANENLNAKLEFTDLSLSLLRSFPALSVRLEGLSLSGIDEFEADTLVSFNYFQTDLNLGSVIFGDEIEIKAIVLDKPIIKALVLENGKANWDIAKEDTTVVEEVVDTSETETTFKIGLKRFEINDAIITYEDRKEKMGATISDLDFFLKGDLSESQTNLNINTTISELTFSMGGIKYLRKANVRFKSDFDANMDSSIYTFKENEFGLNEIVLGFDGSIKMKNEDIEIDSLKFKTKETSFSSVLSLIPEIYKKDISDIKTSGKFELNGFVDGTYNETNLPAFGVNLDIEKGMFKYPDLPKSVNNINIVVKINNKGGSGDNNIVNLKKAHAEIAGNPIDAKAYVSTTADDVDVKAMLKAKMNLASFQDVVPMEDMTLKGIINANINMAGKLSSLESEKYDEFKANGKVELTKFSFKSNDLPETVKIPSAIMKFTPAFVSLDKFDMNIGKSDMHLIGKIDNILPYALQDSTLVARLNFRSKFLDLNDLMSESETGTGTEVKEPVEDTAALTAFEIPGNIDFLLKSKLDKIKYDNLDITNLVGDIALKNSRAEFKAVTMNMLEGSLGMDGSYDSKNAKQPKVAFDMKINNFNIPAAFNAFNTVKQLAPIAKNTNGKFSLDFDFATDLDYYLSPKYESLNGKGRFQSESISIKKSKPLENLSKLTKWKKLENPSLKDVDLKFEIVNGNLTVEPSKMKFGKSELEFGGTQNLNKDIEYNLGLNIPRKELGETVNKVVDNLLAKTGKDIKLAENIKMDIVIAGKLDDPKFKLKGSKDNKGGIKEEIKKGLGNEAKKIIEDADKQAQALIDKAQKEADKVKAEAKKAGNKLVAEADKQGNRIKAEADKKGKDLIESADKKAQELIDNTKNPLAKIGAKKSAEIIRKEARKSADRLNKEADSSAKKLHNEAQAKADKLNKEAGKKADGIVDKAKKEAAGIKERATKKAEDM